MQLYVWGSLKYNMIDIQTTKSGIYGVQYYILLPSSSNFTPKPGKELFLSWFHSPCGNDPHENKA